MVKLANPYVGGTAQLDDFFPLSSVIWAAMEKIGSKQMKSENLAEGSKHEIQLKVSGTVDGQSFEQSISSIVAIGHEQVRASSVNPQVPELLAYLLGKLNTATRNKILTDVPTDFRNNDNRLPEPCPVLLDDARQMLKTLRQTKTVTARGTVRCEYSL